MGALQALVTIVGLIGILAFLLLILCRYLGGWTWTRAWLTSSREEKMVLTRETGQFHPNGFMIRSDSDLNLSGRGSFRRFDRTDQDYQLLRQGSIASIRSQQQSGNNIPPQPLRPAPSLPSQSAVVVAAAAGQQQEQENQAVRLEQQHSTDSVFNSEPVASSTPNYTIGFEILRENRDKSMPPPRIPPPPPPNSVSSTQGGGSSSSAPRSMPSFSMTNPFLPLLQASTQFFSQTIQGLQNFQNTGPPTSNNTPASSSSPITIAPAAQALGEDSQNDYRRESEDKQPPAGYYVSTSNYSGTTSSAVPMSARPTSIHSSTSSARSGISMGELLFSASPSVTSETSSHRIPEPTNPSSEFFNSCVDYSEVRNTTTTTTTTTTNTNPTRQDSTFSNPFSPPVPPVTLSSSYDSSYVNENNSSGPGSSGGNDQKGIFNLPKQLGRGEKAESNDDAERQSITTERASIFEQIRDLNEMSLSKNLESEGNGTAPVASSAAAATTTTTSTNITNSTSHPASTMEPLNSIQISNFGNSSRLTTATTIIKQASLESALKDPNKKFSSPLPSSSLSNIPDNRDPLKIINSSSSLISSTTGGHYSSFAISSYRNARSFSLRQASTDSVGSETDLSSPDGSLPSLQRAMSCDSVCSDTSVVLGELDQSQLTGHLCIGLEYDSETADLLVNVIEAKEINGLHPDPSTPFDSYVRVYLLPDKTTNMQTRVYRKSLNPIYKERFMFGLELAELPIRSLMFYMYATDKYSNTLIGEAELKLRDVDVHQLPMTTWLPLTDSGQRGGDFGEIMFSLSYLPTAERLTVVIVKARNLKFPRDNVGDPFVKVYLLQRGKKVSKKKSSTKRGEKNPIFNEAMIFGVPAHALQTIQLRITVADCSDSDGNRAYSVGHVIVGSMSTGKPLSHWNQMLSSLRKPIAMWHSLRK